MPRLGSDNNDGNEGEEEGRPLLVLAATTAPPRTASTAYAASAGNSRHWQELTMKLLMLMTLTYIARNALFHDYRQDAREYLLNVSGKTEDEIDRHYIPKTAAEKRQSAVQQEKKKVQLGETVAILQQQVDQLQWKVFGTNLTAESDLTDRNSKV